MRKLLAAIFCVISLSACVHTNDIIDNPPIQSVDLQWDCSPKADPLPDDATLTNMKSYELFMRYKDAWEWGDRCDRLLQLNKENLAKDQANRQAASPPK